MQPLMGVIFHNSLVPLFNSIIQRYQGQLQFTEVFLMSLSPLLSILLFVFSLRLFLCYFPPCWINLAYQTLFPFFVLYSRDICVASKLQRANSFCLVIVCWWCMKQTEDSLNFHKFNWACRHKDRNRQNPSQCDTVSWHSKSACCLCSVRMSGLRRALSITEVLLNEGRVLKQQTSYPTVFFTVQESPQFLMDMGSVLPSCNLLF